MPGFSIITGDESIVYADNVSFDGTERGGKITTNGEFLIGATAAPHIRKGSLTSTGSTLSISTGPGTINLETNGSTVGNTITGNSGTISPTAGNWNIVTANSTIRMVGSGSTLTQDFNNTNIAFGTSLPSLTTATGNVFIGTFCCPSVTSAQTNVFLGTIAGFDLTEANNNVGIGGSALANLTTGSGSNTAIGASALLSITTGTRNIGLGQSAGTNYTGAESNNICISNLGVVGESNVMRLGTQGTSPGQVDQTHIAGVINTVSGRVVKVTTPPGYPYATVITDYLILVSTAGGARTINPIASPVTGTTYRIKDASGNAAANNITITPTGKNIDGAASYVISTNYGSVDIVYNGTEWNVL